MAAHGRDDLTPVAVCIPAFGDAVGLERTLASVGRLRHPRHLTDVIVAIDGPDPALERVVAAHDAFAVVLERNLGSYAARNAALERLPDRAEAVLFTDADVAVTEEWIGAHLATLRTTARSAGAVEFELQPSPRPAELVDASRHLDQAHYSSLGYAATVNLAVRREVVAALRFDPTLRSGGDLEFGRRCQESGYDIAFSPEAIVRHPARRSTGALLRKVDRVAKGAANPQFRDLPAVARRKARRTLRMEASLRGLRPSPLWLGRAKTIDVACSLTYARRHPEIVLPAVKRRLRKESS